MHQVVGRMHALQRGSQAVDVPDVAIGRFAAAVITVGLTRHRSYMMTVLEQCWDKPRTDKAGRAGDEYRCSHAVPTVPRGRSDASDGHALPHSSEVTRRDDAESECDRRFAGLHGAQLGPDESTRLPLP